MTLYGWDASDFDWPRGPMDLAAARADGISFFTHKATEATYTKHIHYREAMYRAQNAGIPFLGAYHVVRTGDINAQVDYFLAYVNTQTPWWKSFPGWFFQADLEKWPYDAVAPALGVTFAAEVERRTSKRCLLYGPEWAYGNSIGGSAPLWASAYGSNTAGPYRAHYPGDSSYLWAKYSGRVPVIGQFGSQATIGRQPGCDINAFRGTVADFAALIHGETPLGGGVPIATAQGDWFDMATTDDLKNALRSVLNEGTAAGQQNWATTNKAILGGIQTAFNEENQTQASLAAVAAKIPAVDAFVAAVHAELSKIPTVPSVGGLTPADVEAAVRNVLHNA